MQPEEAPPIVFISYSHDNEAHKSWVLQLAARLRSNGVDVILDAWNVKLGTDLPQFMEAGLSKSKRVICVCTEIYVKKANEKTGGAGYEKQIMSAVSLRNLNTEWIIPLIRDNNLAVKLPVFLDGKSYVDFTDDGLYDKKYEVLLRDIHERPILPIPLIGKNPFQNIRAFANQSFIPASEKYVSPAAQGAVTFDYSNNNGNYAIGQGSSLFEIKFSKGSNASIHVYNDSKSVESIALVKDVTELNSIEDARIFDTSSRARTVNIGQIIVLQNTNGFYAGIKILSIKDDTRGNAQKDEVVFEYFIQTNGSASFISDRPSNFS